MSKKRVAILGLGASGIYLARAAYDMGCDVQIFSQTNPTFSPGAFWLHWIPETVKAEPVSIHQYFMGEEQQYIYNQWGEFAPMVKSSSWGTDGVTLGYDPTKVLPLILPDVAIINNVGVKGLTEGEIVAIAEDFDWTFQTFPQKRAKNTIDYVIAQTVSQKSSNDCVYWGRPSQHVRMCNLFGWRYIEFAKGMSAKDVAAQLPGDRGSWKLHLLRELHPETKPTHSDIYKHTLVGRWAEHNPKRLSHEAYKIAQDILKEI